MFGFISFRYDTLCLSLLVVYVAKRAYECLVLIHSLFRTSWLKKELYLFTYEVYNYWPENLMWPKKSLIYYTVWSVKNCNIVKISILWIRWRLVLSGYSDDLQMSSLSSTDGTVELKTGGGNALLRADTIAATEIFLYICQFINSLLVLYFIWIK